jgi:hypothetical protein
MRFNAEGAVTDLGINGRRLPLASDRGGVYITDVRSGRRARLAAEALEGQGFTGRMKEMGLNGEVRYIGEDEFIRVRIDVEDTTGEDRPLTLSFCLPVEADGWRWDRDPRTSQTIQIGKEEFRLFPSNTKSGGTCFGAEQWASLLPFGALTDGKRLGLALATEANTPRLTRIELDETGFFSPRVFGRLQRRLDANCDKVEHRPRDNGVGCRDLPRGAGAWGRTVENTFRGEAESSAQARSAPSG